MSADETMGRREKTAVDDGPSDTTPDVHRVVHPWLGCAWGRDLISAADRCICTEQAVQVLAIHPAPGDPRFVELLLCAKHRDIVLAASTPTEGVTP